MVIKKKLAILTVVKVRKKTLIMMMPIMLEVMTIGSIVHNLQLLCHHHYHHRGGWNWNKEIIPCNHRDDLDWYTVYLWSGKCGKFWDSLQATISSTILLSNSIIIITIIQYPKTHRDNFWDRYTDMTNITISCWAYFQQNKIVKSQPITSLAGAGTAPDVSQSLISESVWSIRDISHTHIFIHPGGQIKMCFRHGLIKN